MASLAQAHRFGCDGRAEFVVPVAAIPRIQQMDYKTEYRTIASFVTKDRSIIRELIHPAAHGNRNQSVAEAIVPCGETTRLHRHNVSEEIYHIIAGTGRMRVGTSLIAVELGDTIWIPPGTAHNITNTGPHALKILCCCAPPYADKDTELLDERARDLNGPS